MTAQIDFSKKNIERLKKFIDCNFGINFRFYNLQDEKPLSELKWKGFEKNRESLLPLILAYQRVLRIMPQEREHYAFVLLGNKIHSALQIAAMTLKQYTIAAADMFPGDSKAAEEIYRNALDKRSTILVQYMDIVQNSEPHISAARFS